MTALTGFQKEKARRRARLVKERIAECLTYIEAGDATKAYAAAEQAQHLAFDLKDVIAEAAKIEVTA